MKIGITCYPTIGGSGILATELGIKLAQRGHQIHFITSSMPVRLKDENLENIFFHKVESWDYPVFKTPPYTLALGAKMAEVASKVSIDIIHVHYAIPHAASAYIASNMLKNQNIKIITTLHGTDITLVGSKPTFIPLTNFFIEQSNGITAVSQHLKDITNKIFNTKKEIEVIYNFVDTNKFKPSKDMALRKKLAPLNHKVLIHMSNFRPVKRVLNTIRTFDIIRKEIPATLLMLGVGEEKDPAMRLVDSMGLNKSVKFLGAVKSVENILPIADLFIINSIKESFGLAVLEAASCGVPAIVTDIGGLKEVVKDGETGFISPRDNIEDMAKKTLMTLKNSNLLKEMSHKARKRAINKFNWEKIIPQYEQFYKKILGE